MAAYIIKSWRWKLICLCAWNVNAAHTQTHTGTPFVVVVVGQAGTCVVRVTAWVCVGVCEWVWHVSDICLKVFWQPLLDIHWKHIHLTHTHTKTDTHTTRHITHTHPSHTDTRNRCINCWRRLFDLFLARTVPHTLPHAQCTDPRFTHTSKKLIKMRCADIVVRSSPSSSPFASLPSITAKNKV